MIDLTPYDELVDQGYLKRVEFGDLVLYNYTPRCMFEQNWNAYTLRCRGIIFTKEGELVAKPFPKFFNLEEHLKDKGFKLPNLPYEIFDKVDGSLGILYWYQKIPRIATRGSFTSAQAQLATTMLNNYPNLNKLKHLTLLFEIVYPENRVNEGARLVVDYGSTKDLILLAGYRLDGLELTYDELTEIHKEYGFPLVTKYNMTLEEAIAMQKTLPVQQEGFVIRFKNGFRIKIKGQEYLRMSKILNSITPLFIWEHLVDGALPKDFLMGVPEEIRDDVLKLQDRLLNQYLRVKAEILKDSTRLPQQGNLSLAEYRKTIGLFLKEYGISLKHPSAMFPFILKQNLDQYIKDCIKPIANFIEDL